MAMGGQYTEAHDIDSEIDKQNENKLLNKYKWNYKSYQKKKIVTLKHYYKYLNGTQQRNQHVRKETKRSKREQFLRKKNTWILEWVLCTTSDQVGTVHLA